VPFKNPVLAAWGRDYRFWWQNSAQECGLNVLFNDFNTTSDALGTVNTNITDLGFDLTPILGIPDNNDHGPFIAYRYTLYYEPNLPAATAGNTLQVSLGVQSGAFPEQQTNRAQDKWAEASHRIVKSFSWYLYLDRRNTIAIRAYIRHTTGAPVQIWTLNNEGTKAFLEPLPGHYQSPDVFDYSDA
jgi:hypothetical protein